MEAAGLKQFEEGLLQHLTDPDFRNAAESNGAQQLCDTCDRWLSGKRADGTPTAAEIWQACVNVLEHPLPVESVPQVVNTAVARPGSGVVAVVARTRSVVEQDAARAADFVLVLARSFASSAAHEEAAKAYLYIIESCPCLMAELTDVAIPDHAPPDDVAERWRQTDFAKTVDAMLDSALRARLPLGRQLGEALIRHCALRQFDHSVVDGEQGVAGVTPHNVRGALYTSAVLMLEILQSASWSQQDYTWLRTAMCKFVLAACDQSREFPGYVNEEKIAARMCGPWRKAGLMEEARRLAVTACATRPFRAATVDSVHRMLDMFGSEVSVEHADVQDFWRSSVAHLQRPCDVAGVFDKPYIVILVCFEKWRELYAVVGWAFCAACGTDGSDYCAIRRTGTVYDEDAELLPVNTMPSETQQGVSSAATKKRKRERASATNVPTNTVALPAIKLPNAMDMSMTHQALQHLKRDPREFRDAVRTLLRPAEMLLTVLATSSATRGVLLQQIRPLIVAAARLYYCEGTAADDVLRQSTLSAQLAGEWDRACTMADLMDQPVLVLRTVDLLIVALCKHLGRCDLEGLKLRLEYGQLLVRARARCWIACLPPLQTSAKASYKPMVQWLDDWGKRTFTGAAEQHELRLEAEVVQELADAAAAHPQLAADIRAVLGTYAGM